MAKGSAATKKKEPLTPKASNILSFFGKKASPGQTPRRQSSGRNGTQDVKPLDKGKGNAVDPVNLTGTQDDPVVISDDDEIVATKVAETKKRRTSGRDDPFEVVSSPEAGPSTPRKRSPSPSDRQAVPVDAPPLAPPPTFDGYPDWKPPPTWPDIVNTADVEVDDVDMPEEEVPEVMTLPDCGVPIDEEAEQGEGEEHEEDRVIGEDDDDSVMGREDFHHADHDDDQPSRADAQAVDKSPAARPASIPEPIAIDDEPGEVPDNPLDANAGAGPLDDMGDMGIGLDMAWEEGDDEGMGMEEEGDDDKASVVSFTGSTMGKRSRDGEKVTKCPTCGMSMKGKTQAVITAHIAKCHDSMGKGSRPISSFAPSSRPSSPSGSRNDAEEDDVGSSAQTKGPNAFSVLMSGHKEKEQWKDAEIDLRRDGKRTFGRRKAPFYKVLTGMPVAVDAFRYGAVPKVTAYLLTHAHSDHYTNLSKAWNHGPIYCSQTTANLIVHMLGVEPQWVHGLPEDVPFEMPNTGGVTVTVIEANHCPGSSIFLFEGKQTVNAGDSGFNSPYVGSKRIFRYLHCGDFRACPKMVLHPAIARARIDTCYLDTTYLNPKYCFPPQPQVIEACASLARKTCIGISEDAPPVPDIKPMIKPLIKTQLSDDGDREENESAAGKFERIDRAMLALEAEERGKEMMAGWLVKKEETDVKTEPGVDTAGRASVPSDPNVDGVRVKMEDGEKPLQEAKPKKQGRTLVVMGTYSIGKERIVKAVAKALGTKIYCDPRKRGILLCQTDPELHALLSTDPFQSQVHLLPLGNIQLDRLQPYLARLHPHFDRVLGFRPTGWSYSPPAGTHMMPDINLVIRRDQARYFTDASLKPMRGSSRDFMMYGVPYSEHSSFFELTCFALSMPGPDLKMIATVNVGNEKSRAKMKSWFEKWQAEKAKRKEKGLPSVVDYRDVTYW